MCASLVKTVMIAYKKKGYSMIAGDKYKNRQLKNYACTDYTKWRRQKFDNAEADEFYQAAIAYSIENPFCRRERSHVGSDR